MLGASSENASFQLDIVMVRFTVTDIRFGQVAAPEICIQEQR